MYTSSSSSVLLLILWAATTITLTTTSILRIAEASNIDDQPTVHCSPNSVCPNTYPICCSGFCVSAGSYCCGSNNCDPGEQCCRDGCCPPGSSCTEHGCYPDAPCSTYTDPGLCLSPFKPDISPSNATTKTPTTGCVWSCTDRRCMSSADAMSRGSMTSSYPTLTTLEDQCPDVCNNAFTCKQCLNGSRSTQTRYNVPCYWCAANQRCTYDSSCSSYMKVFTDDHCSDVLFRGAGVFPVTSVDDSQQLANWLNGGTFLSLAVFIFGIVIMTVMLFMVVKMALQQRRTPEGVARQRDQQEEHITRAVPRFGFEDDDENNSDSDDDKKKGQKKHSSSKKSEEKRSLIKGNNTHIKNKSRTMATAAVSGLSDNSMEEHPINFNTIVTRDEDEGREGRQVREDDKEDAINTTTTSQRCCSVCKVATGGESKRNFIVASEKEQEKVASWSYVVVLPCNHKLCKKCLINAQTAKATKSNPRRILQKAGGVFSRIRAAADISENAAATTTVEAPPAVVPLGDEDVSSTAVLAALGDNHACLCCTSTVKCVFIPSKMLK